MGGACPKGPACTSPLGAPAAGKHWHIEPVEGNPLAVTLHLTGPPDIVDAATGASTASPYAGRVFEATILVDDKCPFNFPVDILWKVDAHGKSTLVHPLVNSAGVAGAAGGAGGASMCTMGFRNGWGAASMLCADDGPGAAACLARKLWEALRQPAADEAVNQEVGGLLVGAHRNFAEFCKRAKEACASLPAAH